VLGQVFQRARDLLNRSPEQVGAMVGISGRTVRRLEVGEAERPRRVTLEALAGFYGLNPDLVVWLGEFPADAHLLHELRERVRESLGQGVVDALEGDEQEEAELAMRLARLGGARGVGTSSERGQAQLVISFLRNAGAHASAEHSESVQAFVDFLALTPERQAAVRQILHDMRLAQGEEPGP
jgi:transcriptional regulator with XRE-family HTH domain